MHHKETGKKLGAIVLAWAALWATSARAAAIPSYSYFYAAGQAAYTAPAGSDFLVPLYLQEVSTDDSSLINLNSGLFEASVSVSVIPTDPPATNTTKLTDISGNVGLPPNGFDLPAQKNISDTIASLSETTNIDDPQGVTAVSATTDVHQVFLGMVKVHLDSAIGKETFFTVDPADAGFGNSSTNGPGFYNLDDNTGAETVYFSAAGTTFSITTTPEPGIIGMAILCGMALGRPRRQAVFN